MGIEPTNFTIEKIACSWSVVLGVIRKLRRALGGGGG